MQNKPWRNEELKEFEEALPRLKEGDLDKASRVYKAKTGGFQPKVPLDLTKETRGDIVEFLEMVEQSGKWPQQSCTTMFLCTTFFLIPKNVTSERPIALIHADDDPLVGSLKSTRSGEVAAEVSS